MNSTTSNGSFQWRSLSDRRETRRQVSPLVRLRVVWIQSVSTKDQQLHGSYSDDQLSKVSGADDIGADIDDESKGYIQNIGHIQDEDIVMRLQMSDLRDGLI